MKMEMNEMVAQDEDKEPIYFAPKRVSLVSDVASILSWVVLVGFVGDFVVQLVSLSGANEKPKPGSRDLDQRTLLLQLSLYQYD